MKKNYLQQLWKRDKKLGLLVLLFLIGQAFFSYKQIETVPFFNYGMYARPTSPAASYSSYRLYDAQHIPIDLTHYKASHFLAYQLHYYAQLNSQSLIDRPLRQTIQQRFFTTPVLQAYLVEHLTNKAIALPHAQRWLSSQIKKNKLSLWKENYVWVKNNFVLLTKELVY